MPVFFEFNPVLKIQPLEFLIEYWLTTSLVWCTKPTAFPKDEAGIVVFGTIFSSWSVRKFRKVFSTRFRSSGLSSVSFRSVRLLFRCVTFAFFTDSRFATTLEKFKN